MWAVQELDRLQNNEEICSCSVPECDNLTAELQRLSLFDVERERHVLAAVRDLLNVLKKKQLHNWYSLMEILYHAMTFDCHLCRDCYELDQKLQQPTLALARQRIVDLYGDIFPHQVWNLQNGKVVLEEVFSARAQLNNCFYWCHITVLANCKGLFCDIDKHLSLCTLSLCNIALVNAVGFMLSSLSLDKSLLNSSLRSSFLLETIPVEFYNHLVARFCTKQSMDGKWMAKGPLSMATWDTAHSVVHVHDPGLDTRNRVDLFKIDTRNHEFFDYIVPDHMIKGAEEFEFTYSSDAVVYRERDNSFHALCLRTGTVLSSVSGYRPLYNLLKEQVGFVFRAEHDEKRVLVSDFPTGLLRLFINPSNEAEVHPVGVTFTLAGDMLSLCSHSMVIAWKTEGDGSVTAIDEFSLKDTYEQVTRMPPVQKYAFSREGSLIATLRSTEILLYHRNMFLCCVLEESVEEKCNVSCLAFSADDTLLFYCIEKTSCFAHLYLWDVQKREVSSVVACRRTTQG